MPRSFTRSFAAATLVLGLTVLAISPVHAQAGGATRAQVKMDRDSFLAMARWDELTGLWVLKSDMALPEGIMSRAEVVAMRDKFISMHTWNEPDGQWVPVKGAPREMSKLTRDQVQMETVRFLMMYRFDEGKREWVSKAR
jgi:hypothetical protein